MEILPFAGNGVNKSIAKSERFDYEVPDYEQMLQELYDWMNVHRELYAQYAMN